MIEIVQVKTKKQQRLFVEFPHKYLYKKNPYYVPPLYMDEMKLFTKANVYADQADSIFFLAYKDGKPVGRIQGIHQRKSNEKWNEKKVRFTRFDSIDDQEVATKLFEAIEKWAKGLNMTTVVGPLGYSDLDREGLLVEGFDQLSTFEEQYNYPYYQKLIENLGYTKEVGWVERQIRPKEVKDERLEHLSALMLKRYNLKFGEAKNVNDFIKKYGDQLFDVLDETYNNIYGTIPFTDAMKKMMISNFKLIVSLKYVGVIVDENDRVVCFAIAFPSIAKALQKSNGHLTIPALFRVLKALKHPKILDCGLIGVLDEYKNKGVASAVFARFQNYLYEGTIEYAETNLNLEDNNNIQNQWKIFDNVIHKRRISLKKDI